MDLLLWAQTKCEELGLGLPKSTLSKKVCEHITEILIVMILNWLYRL